MTREKIALETFRLKASWLDKLRIRLALRRNNDPKYRLYLYEYGGLHYVMLATMITTEQELCTIIKREYVVKWSTYPYYSKGSIHIARQYVHARSDICFEVQKEEIL
jgi:hypothetical protein